MRRAANVADTPMALVSIVGAHTQIFRSQHGLPPELAVACGTSRSVSFCQIVVKTEAMLVINDAASDVRVSKELVEQFGVRAYAGAPIRRGPFVVGSFCVVDVVPRTFTPEVLDTLQELADTVGTYLDTISTHEAKVAIRERSQEALRARAESLVAALSVITPIAMTSRGLRLHDVTPELLGVVREALGQALTFYDVVAREVLELEVLGHDGPMHKEIDRLSRIVAEIGVMARVGRAYASGQLGAANAARALSVSRDVFDAADALADAAIDLIDKIDSRDGGAS